MSNRYFEGPDIRPKNTAAARKLIGKRVKYLRNIDIDRSGRGYYWPQFGIVTEAHQRQIVINGDWVLLKSIVEMVEVL